MPERIQQVALKRVFVANRGEIAVRIVRACRAAGLEVVVGTSEADRSSMAARLADRAVCLGPAPAAQSYLRAELLVTAARGTGCQALHPGYGFLSERASLQRACAENGIAFVGPSAEAIDAMGDKLSAIRLAKAAGVPVVPGSERLADLGAVKAAAEAIGYPCLLKASAGGGGRGMRIVRDATALSSAFESAQAEALAAFGDATVYLEKFIERARHIEIQVLGDHHGNLVHLFDRDCSVQRRHQKLIEEAPSPVLPPARRTEMAEAALALARGVGYFSAGTVEFVYDADADRFYFLEMNTRIQVEHPVTEMITGIDLVREQLRIAAGERLSIDQRTLAIRGHAIECRINAEDPLSAFRPTPGRITRWRPPIGDGLRLDTHCEEGVLIPPFYDSMVAKMIAHGTDREQARARLVAALARFEIDGIATTIALDRAVLEHPAFANSSVTTRWLETEFLPHWNPAPTAAPLRASMKATA
jgi:acetyl-CoA carboxylase biotin carboxylase subunit